MGGFSEEEDWYLASGGMCQRNSCRLRRGFERRTFGRDYRFYGKAAALPTAPLCQRILVIGAELLFISFELMNTGKMARFDTQVRQLTHSFTTSIWDSYLTARCLTRMVSPILQMFSLANTMLTRRDERQVTLSDKIFSHMYHSSGASDPGLIRALDDLRRRLPLWVKQFDCSLWKTSSKKRGH